MATEIPTLLKHDVEPLEFALDKISELEIKSYTKTVVTDIKKAREAEDGQESVEREVKKEHYKEYGVMAQQVLDTKFDFTVNVTTDTPYSISHNNMFVAGLKATQELYILVKVQADLIEKLEARIVSLETKELEPEDHSEQF